MTTDLSALVPAERRVLGYILEFGGTASELLALTPLSRRDAARSALARLCARTNRRGPIVYVDGVEGLLRVDHAALETYVASKQPRRRNA